MKEKSSRHSHFSTRGYSDWYGCSVGTGVRLGRVFGWYGCSIGTGVVKANEPNLLKEYGGPLELSEDWARYVLKSMEWVKRNRAFGWRFSE